jgi:hypothetical protein
LCDDIGSCNYRLWKGVEPVTNSAVRKRYILFTIGFA